MRIGRAVLNTFLFTSALSASICAVAQSPQQDIAIQKTVDNAFPTGPGQTVEFTVTAENVGSEGMFNITIEDKLPEGLSVPEVMVPYASAGSYSSETGYWELSGIAPGGKQTLTIPAVATGEVVPPCIVNRAKLLKEDDDQYNNDAAAAIHGEGVERCVDLDVYWGTPVSASKPCGGAASVEYSIYIHNRGPEDARNVSLTARELSAFKLPGLELSSSRCPGNVCTWDTMLAGKIYSTSARSRSFKNSKTKEHRLRLEVTTADHDYEPDNNISDTTRTIGSFSGACPDYGIPAPYFGAGGGSGGGCFIATAAYGTPYDERITILRQFRDRWMLRTAPGRYLVDIYYQHSPPLARYIAEKPGLKFLVRLALTPVIAVIGYPLLSALVLSLLLASILAMRHRKKL